MTMANAHGCRSVAIRAGRSSLLVGVGELLAGRLPNHHRSPGLMHPTLVQEKTLIRFILPVLALLALAGCEGGGKNSGDTDGQS